MRVGPANYGHHVARRTAHADGSLGQRRAAGTTGTDAVARPPVLRGGGGVPQSRHDRPEAGTDRDDLDEGPRHAQRPPVDFEDDIERRELHDAIPGAAEQLAISSSPDSCPMFQMRRTAITRVR